MIARFMFFYKPGVTLSYKKSLRRLCIAQGLYDLVGHSGSFCQILTKFVLRTVSFGSLPKGVQTSGWPVGFHQPKYVTYVLAGNVGNESLEGSRHPAKPPSQRERLISKSMTQLDSTSPQRTCLIGRCKDMMSKIDPMRAWEW